MNNKFLRVFSILALAALILSACGASAPARPPLKVAWIMWPGYYPLLIAQEKGFFEARGVKVQPVQVRTSQEQLVAITTNSVDGALLVLTDVVHVSGESDLRIVLVADASTGGDLIVAPGDVNSVADLKGKRIGATLGSFGEMFVREMLRQNGMTASDVQIVNVLPENLPDALGRTADGGHTYEPYASEAFKKGYKVIFSTAQAPTLIMDTMAFLGTVVDQRPDDVRAFTAAWFDAVAWWQANPAEGNALIAQLTNQQPGDISLEGLKLYNKSDNLGAFTTGSGSVYQTTQKTVEFYTTSGALTTIPDLNKFLDPSFIQ